MPCVARSILTAACGLAVVFLLGGCVSVSHLPMTKETSAKLTAKKVAVVKYEAAEFLPFTADKAGFGIIGAGLMIAAGKEMVTQYDLEDPAVAVREQLTKLVVERRGTPIVVVDSTKPVTKDDIPALIAAYPGADYLLDIKTFNNTMTYYPTNWVGYRYMYSARVRVVEVAAKSVAAETLCSTAQGDDANPPSYDQMVADRAALLKSYMAKAASTCASLIAKDLLQLEYTDAQLKAAEVSSLSLSGVSLAQQPSATTVVAANPSPDSPVARYRLLSRSEISSLMNRPWEFVRPTDNDRIRWEFWGSTVYSTVITSPGRYSGDWQFNQRNEVCVDLRTRRAPIRCVAVARDGETLVLIDSNAPDSVFSVLELK